MPAANQPKGSVSTGSIKPVTRKAVRCQREVAWLVTQAAGKLVATTDDVNAPTPSFVLAAALSYTRKQEQAAQDNGRAVDYDGRHSSRPCELLSGCGAARSAQRAFGRGLHVHALGCGSDPRPLCLLQRPGRTHGRRGAGQARLRDQTRAAVVLARRRLSRHRLRRQTSA
mgnify:CR=1 FL=1